jgi:hypothetical protein
MHVRVRVVVVSLVGMVPVVSASIWCSELFWFSSVISSHLHLPLAESRSSASVIMQAFCAMRVELFLQKNMLTLTGLTCFDRFDPVGGSPT